MPPKTPSRSMASESTGHVSSPRRNIRVINPRTIDRVSDPSEPATHVLVRVWLPDRPGALGLVASRIGAIGGDIVGIDVLERGDNVAVDEFAVLLPQGRSRSTCSSARSRRSTARASRRCARSTTSPTRGSTRSSRSSTLCAAGSVEALHRTLVEQTRAEFAADWSALLVDGDGAGVGRRG